MLQSSIGSYRSYRLLWVCILALVATTLLPTTPAHAHFLGYSAVDGREIAYDDFTQWDDARATAIRVWNDLGSIAIVPDGSFTYADLDIQDYNSNDGRCGFYRNQSGADEINLNNFYYPGYNGGQRNACMSHEMGHALGIDHSYTDQVMDPCPVCYNSLIYVAPQPHDISDYRYLWG